MSLISLDKVLKSVSPLGSRDVLRHARQMSELTETLRGALPPEAKPYLVGASLREDGELVLVCRSPSWAARLRFERDSLLAAACAAGAEPSRLTVRVAKP